MADQKMGDALKFFTVNSLNKPHEMQPLVKNIFKKDNLIST